MSLCLLSPDAYESQNKESNSLDLELQEDESLLTDMALGTELGSSLRAVHALTDEPSLQSLILFLAIVVFCLFSLFFISFYFLIAFLWVNWSCFHLLEF